MAKKNGNLIAVLAMIFLFGMISFVTNLAAPVGNIWKMQPQIAGSNALGMMGNMMNFLAYAIMGIPAGNMLTKYGYKKTALIAIAVGFIGVFVQFLSGVVSSFPSNFIVYLLGAFIAGFSVCMLNTVVNPMLKLLGGARSPTSTRSSSSPWVSSPSRSSSCSSFRSRIPSRSPTRRMSSAR